MEDRRELFRRAEDHHICVFHAEADERIKSMNTKINIGIGLFLAATLIITLLVYSIDRVEAHVLTQQSVHEKQIKGEQVKLSTKVDSVDSNVRQLTLEVAILQTQFKDTTKEWDEDRDEILDKLNYLLKRDNK